MRIIALAILSLVPAAVVCAQADDSPFRAVLTSTGDNLQHAAWQIAASEVTPDCPAPWSIRLETLHGGKQEGVHLIRLDNGRITLEIVPTRGMGILRVVAGDTVVGWHSPVREVVHPKFINLHSRGGLGWLDGFNEWLCRCGIESNGQAGLDKFINNMGDEATMELTLHGKVANLPAQQVEVLVDRHPPFTIRVRGRVDERMFYGPKFALHTEISTEPGSMAFRLTDVLHNDGAGPQEFQMLYHVNFGAPLLGEGTTLVAPTEQVRPFNAHAAKAIDDFATFAKPQAGFVEQVYFLRLWGDQRRRTQVLLRNLRGDRGVSLAWSLDELPCFTLWKNTAAEADGYVTGLEPGTNYPQHRSTERQAGRVPKLAPGAAYTMAIDFTVLLDRDSVERAAAAVQALQADRPTMIDPEPVLPRGN